MIRIYENYVVLVNELDYVAAIDTGKHDKKGKQIYNRLGYYGTLKSAVEGIAKYDAMKELRTGDMTLQEVCKVLSEINERLENILKNIEG